jgi:hypothetical protein
MVSIYSSSTHHTRVDGTILPYRYLIIMMIKSHWAPANTLPLFRGAALKPSSVDSSLVGAQDDETRDIVLDELKWWELLDLQEYSQYI